MARRRSLNECGMAGLGRFGQDLSGLAVRGTPLRIGHYSHTPMLKLLPSSGGFVTQKVNRR